MNEKELKEFKAALLRQREEVQGSKKAARELLNKLGLLTPSGNLKKSFKPAASVSR
jgi:hypothetical protein